MSCFSGKRVLLGVTGGIAAYKTPGLIRLLVKEGAEVRVMMTKSARYFVAPLALATVSKNPVFLDFIKEESNTIHWESHIKWALWADILLMAPVTSNTLAKMVSGASDSFFLATYMSAKCPVYIAPAMDLDMAKHPATKKNIAELKSYGHNLLPFGSGELASGLYGKGRMLEPEDIVRFIQSDMVKKLTFGGKKFLITAGPTREPLDPVRFVSNYSSGKMGYHLAEEALKMGAEVHLISGPTCLPPPRGSEYTDVTTAEEMYKAVMSDIEMADIIVMAAAVSDFKPKNRSSNKIKKDKWQCMDLELTKDILAAVGKCKASHQYLMGFALETENFNQNALKKLKTKNADAIILNGFEKSDSFFGSDTNQIKIFDRGGDCVDFEKKNKREVAKDILNFISEKCL